MLPKLDDIDDEISPYEKRLRRASVWGDAFVYDERFRIPLLILGPKIPAKKITQQVRSIDIFPTIFEIAGLNKKPLGHGKSLLPLIQDNAYDELPAFLEGAANAPKFVNKNISKFIKLNVKKYIKQCTNRNVKKMNLKSFWVVRQYKNEYNPVHFHQGYISAVGYLKVPKNLTKSKKNIKTNGTIDFINGTKTSLINSIHNHIPKTGDMIIFPNNLMHTAYPFNVEGERRSFSFNLDLDNKTKKLLNV